MRPKRFRSPRCSICRCDSRAQIEAALALGLSCRNVAQRFGVGEDSVQRHKQAHMDPQHIARILFARKPQGEIDLEALQKVESDKVLAELVDHRCRLAALRDMALAQGGIGLTHQIELSMRGATLVIFQVIASLRANKPTPQFTRLERVIVDPLQPEPEPLVMDHEPLVAEPPPPPIEPAPPPPPIEPPRNVVPLDPPIALFGFQGRGR